LHLILEFTNLSLLFSLPLSYFTQEFTYQTANALTDSFCKRFSQKEGIQQLLTLRVPTRAAPLLRSHAHPSASATLEAKGARQVVHLRLGGSAAADSAELRRERRRRTQHRHGHGCAWSWPA
jgi:hypothetical protein